MPVKCSKDEIFGQLHKSENEKCLKLKSNLQSLEANSDRLTNILIS